MYWGDPERIRLLRLSVETKQSLKTRNRHSNETNQDASTRWHSTRRLEVDQVFDGRNTELSK